MNENINLLEILKGHEGETFYSPFCGQVILCSVNNTTINCKSKADGNIECITLWGNGTVYLTDGECMLFPSKDQRDWNKWVEEQNNKVPKTWSELIKTGNSISYTACTHIEVDNIPIVKSAKALLRIHQLIEVGYGGNADKTKEFYSISYDIIDKKFIVRSYQGIIYDNFIIAFNTEEQAKEFLSYPDNVQLLEDYFMIM